MSISVKVRFSCPEVTGDARNGEYRLPDNCTVKEFMDLAAKENGSFAEGYMEFVLFVVNGKTAQPDTVLHDSDMVRVLGMVYGG